MTEGYLIIAGDKRQLYLKNILKSKGKDVFHIAYPADLKELDVIEKYSHIILPVPLTKDKKTIYSIDPELKIEPGLLRERLLSYHKVYSGGELSGCRCSVVDLMKDMTFKRANALLTAQGALRLLLDNTESYITGKKALIIGFGDVAETLADLLSKIGLSVHIKGRNKTKLITAGMLGYEVSLLSKDENCLEKYDFIFGSVPTNVLTEKDIGSISDEAIYFELASAPFTADEDLFYKYGKRYVLGSALPGKYLPLASAELIADFILSSQ